MSLQCELDVIRRARRLVQGTDPGNPNAIGGSKKSFEDDTVHNVVNASGPGAQMLIAPPGQSLDIMEIFLWNASGTQTLTLKDGSLTLVRLTDMAAGTGFVLGFTANGRPHFKVTAGNSLILNLSVGTQVDGFVKYRLAG